MTQRSIRSALLAAPILAFVPVAGADTVDAVGELPDAAVLEIFNGGSHDPFGPLEFVTSQGTVIGTTTSVDMVHGTFSDPAFVGTFDYTGTQSALPHWYGDVDASVNPGDYRGRFQTNKVLTINFDTPLKGVGFTLFNSGGPSVMTTGSTVTAYSGPDGTGDVLGSITSPNTEESCCPFSTPAPYHFLYFRGVRDLEGRIMSVTLTPLNGSKGWGIDTIAVSPASGAAGCNAADIAEPFGLLDLTDVTTFSSAFLAGDAIADLDSSGLLDLADVNLFVSEFVAGCP